MKHRMIVTAEAATELAKAANIEELTLAVATAVDAGWHALELLAEQQEDGSYDMSVLPPTGVMVAWMLPEYAGETIAFPGGEHRSSLHVTLGFFGDASSMSLDDQRKLIGIVGEVTNRHRMLNGQLSGVGRFQNGEETDPFWVGVDIPGLDALQADLVDSCRAAGIEPQGKGADAYRPHVTVAYLPAEQETPPLDFKPLDVTIEGLTVCIGEQRVGPIQLQRDYMAQDEYVRPGWSPMTKAVETVEEMRFTLGPWYVPNQVDAHDEWTDTLEVQKALWGYVRKEDRDIRLQHNTSIRAGEWVEAMTWPFEVTVPLTKADGTTTEYTYPAGTPFMGTVWEPWAWELVKDGRLSGYSIGGRSNRIEVDLGAGDAEIAEQAIAKAAEELEKGKLGACEEWTGAKDQNGYGMRRDGDRVVMAHVKAYTDSGGKLPKGHEVRHKCNNSSCVKPTHLHSGTHQENIDDKKRK